MKITAWVVAAALGMSVSQSFAFDEAQENAISHAGQVFAGEKICSRVKANTGMLASIFLAYRLDITDPQVGASVRAKVDEAVSAWSGKSEDAACAAVLVLYGPDGQNVAGLLGMK